MSRSPRSRTARVRWLPVGTGIGAAVGVAAGAIAVWVALGVAIGALLDALQSGAGRGRDAQDPRS